MRPADMHKADIKCALEKAGWTLRKLSSARGYSPGAAQVALRIPWPAVQRIIADAIGKEPWEIWPTRYDAERRPLRGLRSKRRKHSKHATSAANRNGRGEGKVRHGQAAPESKSTDA